MTDDVPDKSPAEPETVTDAAEMFSQQRKVAQTKKPSARKTVKATKAKKIAKVAKTTSGSRASKRAASTGTSIQVQVGEDTVFIPKALAAHVTPRDLKRLRAVLKRIRKRGRKRAAKKGASKKN